MPRVAEEVVVGSWFARALLVLVALVGAVWVAFFFGMRSKYPPVITAVRQVGKRTWNPVMLRTAGQPGAQWAKVRHVGRTSGRSYETPIGTFEVDDGFVVALPYGLAADWVKNVLAAGSATIVKDGISYTVDQPEVVATDSVAGALPAKEAANLQRFRVVECLRLHTASQAAAV